MRPVVRDDVQSWRLGQYLFPRANAILVSSAYLRLATPTRSAVEGKVVHQPSSNPTTLHPRHILSMVSLGSN